MMEEPKTLVSITDGRYYYARTKNKLDLLSCVHLRSDYSLSDTDVHRVHNPYGSSCHPLQSTSLHVLMSGSDGNLSKSQLSPPHYKIGQGV